MLGLKLTHYNIRDPCQFATRYDFNTLRPRQDGRRFPDDILKCIFLNENEWIALKISLKFVPKGQINNIPSLVQIMAWRRPGGKPLSEAMVFSLLTHICVTRPQWVNKNWCKYEYFPSRTCIWNATCQPTLQLRKINRVENIDRSRGNMYEEIFQATC